MRKIAQSLFAAAFCAHSLAVAATALAEDVQVPGKKLLIKNPPSGPSNNKLVFLAKSAGIQIPVGAAQDPTVGGGYLHVSGGHGEFIINLPALGWTVNGDGSLYKYKDTTGATCKIVLIKDAKLEKAVCKGSQVAYNLGPEGAINVILGIGSEPLRHCHRFDGLPPENCDVKKGGGNGTYLVKNCVGTVVGCPSPSGAFLNETNAF
jgi:hypothetical protein